MLKMNLNVLIATKNQRSLYEVVSALMESGVLYTV